MTKCVNHLQCDTVAFGTKMTSVHDLMGQLNEAAELDQAHVDALWAGSHALDQMNSLQVSGGSEGGSEHVEELEQVSGVVNLAYEILKRAEHLTLVEEASQTSSLDKTLKHKCT